ncbi:MAG TPA: biotin carboxylase N-terminal domain-containing protein [Fimbriimonas sp.]|nr:biotin carboxylase N-terminal domain-containing protein [Fimbriimonas sp.]
MPIRKVLIANRGEIAIRVIRTCREMGISTVAVFSEADENALHAKMADEAVPLGGSQPSESYLSLPKVLDSARETGADAIHPGYGFLSERAELSDACRDAGIAFIGPTGAAMRRLGDKISAKQLAVEGGVPIVPGFFEPGASEDALFEAAERVGYPVMLKAAAGGGGRGMREVESPDQLRDALRLASKEAQNAFGDGAMMVEKLIRRPRHVEVQVLADLHGQVACLFERECSIQRRHQKLIEEAPAPALTSGLVDWEAMRDSAHKIVSLAGYTNAGTVEFIVDPAAGSFYFLEVNARLQVEHPVTEAITALDLVRWQIRIAEGDRLPEGLAGLGREQISGHAIEARVIAEDPAAGFLPSIGKILGWAEPRSPGVRVDTGFGKGSEVSRFYDSLVAKVIAHGASRSEAIQQLRAALEDFHVLGVKSNVDFLLSVLRHPEFEAGQIDTGFLARNFEGWRPSEPDAVVGALSERAATARPAVAATLRSSNPAWSAGDGFRNV